METNKINDYIYAEACKHADIIIIKKSSLLIKIREALIESYMKGFMKASILASNYQNKSKELNGTN